MVREESKRNRCMLVFAYDAALRREELCQLHSSDLDPAHRLLRVRAETTKGRRERVVPYSETAAELLRDYLCRGPPAGRDRHAVFLSESPRNHGAAITLWTWSKVVRSIALRADVPALSNHTLRHLCLTDLARSGWQLQEIARFAGHQSLETTRQYIHLSGRDLADRFAKTMRQIHTWRVDALAGIAESSNGDGSSPSPILAAAGLRRLSVGLAFANRGLRPQHQPNGCRATNVDTPAFRDDMSTQSR